jgi:glutathione S-transferase
MIPTITAFERSPDRGKGLARDMRVRWALEEVGQPYKVRLVSFSAMKEPAHRALHPFGQIPTYEEGDLALFESGAIVLHIAERHAGLLPVVEDRIRDRLGELSVRLGHADWLDGAFSAGDLMMVAVVLRLKASGILDEYPNLSAYVARGEARPAYKRAFDAQLAVFTGGPPAG